MPYPPSSAEVSESGVLLVRFSDGSSDSVVLPLAVAEVLRELLDPSEDPERPPTIAEALAHLEAWMEAGMPAPEGGGDASMPIQTQVERGDWVFMAAAGRGNLRRAWTGGTDPSTLLYRYRLVPLSTPTATVKLTAAEISALLTYVPLAVPSDDHPILTATERLNAAKETLA